MHDGAIWGYGTAGNSLLPVASGRYGLAGSRHVTCFSFASVEVPYFTPFFLDIIHLSL